MAMPALQSTFDNDQIAGKAQHDHIEHQAPAVSELKQTYTSDRLASIVAGSDGKGQYSTSFRARVGNTAEALKKSSSSNYVLPPDVSVEQFEGFIRDVKAIVGDSEVMVNVDGSEDAQAESDYLNQPRYHDFFALTDKGKNMASAAIYATTVEQIQGIVKAANQYLVPLHTVSIGRNLGYGGAAPRLRGAAVLDLSKMNKIIEVNEDSAYVLLEPGVSYFQLYEHLKATGSNLWIDCPDIGWGSVLGNTCERGAGYTPYGDHFMFHCGMEVVLPNSEVMRTGMGAMANSDSWQLFPYGYGPHWDGIFTQSNYGIVTKMGMWLMPNPGGAKAFVVTVENKSDLHELVERIRPLRINMIIQNAPTIRHVLLDAACEKSKAKWEGRADESGLSAPLTEEKIEGIAKDMNQGYWAFYGMLYGPPPVQEGCWAQIWGSLSQIKGSKAFFEKDLPPRHIIHSRAKTLAGIPNLLELDWISWLPNGAHAFFSPISAVTGDAATRQVAPVEKKARAYGFDFMNTLIVGLRELHNINCLVYDKTNPEQVKKMRQCMEECILEAAKEGWGDYRTHNDLMDIVAGTFNFSELGRKVLVGRGAELIHFGLTALHSDGNMINQFNEQIKDAVDPNCILAPGKSGIWGKRFRGKGY